jgi:CubicO group peptidase (beta-lactamase class C family)
MKLSLITLSIMALVGPFWTTAQSLPRAAPQQVGLSQERLDKIKPLEETYVSSGQLAGGVMLIARRGKTAYFESFGSMDVEARKPMAANAIFRIYSMTKPIVAAAALTLYEDGKFSLLDPVSKYLPEFANLRVAIDKTDAASGQRVYYTVPAEHPVTVLDLMRHTSGMTNQGPRDEKGDLIFPRLALHTQTLAEGIKLLASAPLVHQPGTGFDYSPGPDVVGRLIEIWSGKPLDQYLEDRIFKPLHMADTGFWVPEEKWNRLTALYDAAADGSIVRATDEAQDGYRKKPIYLSGSGGLVSTAVDYARFAQMLLNGGELDGARILSPKTVDLMRADLLGELPVFGGPMLPGYGFGLTVAVNRGPAKTATIGSTGEYYWEGAAASLFFVDPQESLITVYMIQKRRGIAISREYKRMVYQAIVERERAGLPANGGASPELNGR